MPHSPSLLSDTVLARYGLVDIQWDMDGHFCHAAHVSKLEISKYQPGKMHGFSLNALRCLSLRSSPTGVGQLQA